jgi:hypothetical protein
LDSEVSSKYSHSQDEWDLSDYAIYITQPLGVLITYGAPKATSDNLAFLAHVALIKSCDAPESNNIMIGRSLRKNVPVSTSSPMGISSTVV